MYSVAIIGAGNIAAGFDTLDSEKILTHAHAVVGNSNFVLKGFYDLDKQKSEAAAKKWSTLTYNTIDELVAEADVCVCCVPDIYHASVIIKIAEYEPRVIITEKPLANSMEQARNIYDFCYEKQPIAVNFSRRYIPEFQEIKQNLSTFGRFTKGVVYYGKGTIHNGSHAVDLLQFFFGNVESVKPTGFVVYDFEDDFTCDAVLSWADTNVYMIGIDSRVVTIFEMDLMFENARIRILDGGKRIERYCKMESKDYRDYYGYKLAETIEVDYNGALIGLYHNIEGFLNGEENLICGLSEGIRVLEVCSKVCGYE